MIAAKNIIWMNSGNLENLKNNVLEEKQCTLRNYIVYVNYTRPVYLKYLWLICDPMSDTQAERKEE